MVAWCRGSTMVDRRFYGAVPRIHRSYPRAARVPSLSSFLFAGLLSSACGTSFGLAPPDDAGSDAGFVEDAPDVATTEDASRDRSADRETDDGARDAARTDVSVD